MKLVIDLKSYSPSLFRHLVNDLLMKAYIDTVVSMVFIMALVTSLNVFIKSNPFRFDFGWLIVHTALLFSASLVFRIREQLCRGKHAHLTFIYWVLLALSVHTAELALFG